MHSNTLDDLINAGGRPVTLALWGVNLALVAAVLLASFRVRPFVRYGIAPFAYAGWIPMTLVWLRITDRTVGELVAAMLRRGGAR
ncbi:MAG: hypothetical protein ABEJ85_03040 [Haloarculaceae archaeon]